MSRTSTDVSIPIRQRVIALIPKLPNIEWLRIGVDLVAQPAEQGQVNPARAQDEPVRAFHQLQLVAGSHAQRVEHVLGEGDLPFCGDLTSMVVVPPYVQGKWVRKSGQAAWLSCASSWGGETAVAAETAEQGVPGALRVAPSRFGQEVGYRIGVVAQHVEFVGAGAVEPVRFLHQVPQHQRPQPYGGCVVAV